jgi:hypothetical protein
MNNFANALTTFRIPETHAEELEFKEKLIKGMTLHTVAMVMALAEAEAFIKALPDPPEDLLKRIRAATKV